MSYYIVQSGSALYRVNSSTGVGTALTIPPGVLIDPLKRSRFASMNRQILMVGSPSDNLWIDTYGIVRRMNLRPPSTPLTLAGTGTGPLNGSYQAKATYFIRDTRTRAIVAESDFGPASAATSALVSKNIAVTGVPINPDGYVDGRRLYRTASGPGEEYFKWVDVDGNLTVSVTDGLDDDGLGVLSAPDDLGAPPGRFDLIVEWKDRLWARPVNDVDTCWFSANRKFYAWPAANTLPIRPLGGDEVGINGFLPRRDELGIARKDIIWKVIGDPPNISLIKLVEGVGVEGPDSIQIIRDIAFWLGKDGVYQWSPDGVSCVSDMGQVRSWFTTDTYFNRARFQYAASRYNEKLHAYELLLAAAGSTSEDRWVTYYIDQKRWLGPHRTDAFTPTVTALLRDANGVALPIVGDTTGTLWKINEAVFHDDVSAGIDFDVTMRHNCKTPDIEKEFLQLSMLTQIQASGVLGITPALGGINAADQAQISHQLTTGRERLRRISTYTQGVGRNLKLRFRQNTADIDLVIYGYEIPWFEAGRR